MSEIRFVTREIGSLAKPGWRVKAIAGRPVEEKDVEEVREWGRRLGIDSGELAEILRKGGGFTNEEKVKIQDFAALYGIRILEHAGLDVVYDGEQRRSEMYDHAVRHTKGFETRGTVRSFDNKYYTKAAGVELHRRDLRSLVRLDVRSQVHLCLLRERRHLCYVALQSLQVDDCARRVKVLCVRARRRMSGRMCCTLLVCQGSGILSVVSSGTASKLTLVIRRPRLKPTSRARARRRNPSKHRRCCRRCTIRCEGSCASYPARAMPRGPRLEPARNGSAQGRRRVRRSRELGALGYPRKGAPGIDI